MHRPKLVVGLLRDAVQGQFPVLHDPDGFFAGVLNPQATGPYVRLDVHWIESLALGEADDGLEASEQGRSGFGIQAFSFHASLPRPASLNRVWNGRPLVRPGSSGTESSRCSRS